MKSKNLSPYSGGGMQLIVPPKISFFPVYSKYFLVPKLVKMSMMPMK